MTGLDINFHAIRFRFLVHPAIQIDDGELISHGHRLVTFKRLTVFYHYRSLLHNRGLPLAAIVVEAPRIRLPTTPATPAALVGSSSPVMPGSSAAAAQLPAPLRGPAARVGAAGQAAPASSGARPMAAARLEPYATQFITLEKQASEHLGQILKTLGNVTLDLGVEDAVVLAADGKPLVTDFSLRISRPSPASGVWQTKFRLVPVTTIASGALITGDGELSPAERADHTWAQGRLRFLRESAMQVAFNGTAVQARPKGNLMLVLSDDGRAAGTISLKLAQAVITSPILKRPTDAADYSFNSSIIFTGDSLRVEQASLKKGSDPLLHGEGALTELATAAPRLTLKVSGLTLNLAQTKLWLGQLKAVPRAAETLAANVQSGRLTLEQAELSTQIGGERLPKKDELARNLHLAANISQAAASLPPSLGLPALTGVQARLLLEKSRLSVSQMQARLGNSVLTAGSVSADLIPSAGQARFIARLNASLALGELYKPALGLAGDRARMIRRYLKAIDGIATLDAKAEGRIGQASKFTLGTYQVELRPRQVSLLMRSPARSVKLLDGTASLVPGLLTVARLHLADGQSNAFLDGSAKIDGRDSRLRRLVVDLQPVEIKNWLGLAVKPKEAIATGLVEGRVSVLGTPGIDPDFSAHGQLSASPASIKLGILRSPIEAQTVVIKLDGRGGEMSVDHAEFEGEKANIKITVPDLMRPVVQIGIHVARLDLRSLKFVHFPGQPKPPPKRFSPETRISGHVKIDRAQVDRLTFSGVTLDFDRRGNNWTVSNIGGGAYGGHALINLTGRSEDEILDVTTQLKAIDVAWFLTAADPSSKPVLSGRLSAEAEFRADTNTNNDLKQTLSGKGSFRVNDGTAYRLKLLARVLSVMSVSGLLRGRLPDPFVEGIPFRVLKANLTCKDGVLHTNDLILDGPVMRLSAVGYVDLPSDALNLTVGVMPFNMVDNVLSLLPVLGNGLASQDSLLAIYVTASGSVSDPSVLPAPITSVTKILKKILSLPVNIINSELKPSSPDN